MPDGEHHRAAEGGNKVTKMPPSELPLTSSAEPDDAAVFTEDIHCQHVFDHGLADLDWNHGDAVAQPTVQGRASHSSFLENQRHHLLSEDMRWKTGRHYLIDLPLLPKCNDRESG